MVTGFSGSAVSRGTTSARFPAEEIKTSEFDSTETWHREGRLFASEHTVLLFNALLNTLKTFYLSIV